MVIFSLDRNVLSNYSVLCRAKLLEVDCLILTIHICPFYMLQSKDLAVNMIGTWENIKPFEEEGVWARQRTSREMHCCSDAFRALGCWAVVGFNIWRHIL